MKLIAHRGGAGLRVENTLAAFEHAMSLGADGAELDVHLTRDGQVVVHHDVRLNPGYCRRVDGDWIGEDQAPAIAESTWSDLHDYEIGVPKPGSAYAAKYDRIVPVLDQRIPLLRDVIRLAKARSPRFRLVIEIKTNYLDAMNEPWRPLVGATLEVVMQEGFFDRSVLCSFDWRTLLHAKQIRPDLTTWFISPPASWLGDGQPSVEDIPPDPPALDALRAQYREGNAPWFAGFDPHRFGGSFPDAIAAAGGDAWLMYHRDCTDQTQCELARRGLESAAWSVNLRDEGELARLVKIGVDNLLVDYPDVDIEALSRSA
jgi:glycerophosphoryl diester phosphodiesterase